jgi:hypothetical protein
LTRKPIQSAVLHFWQLKNCEHRDGQIGQRIGLKIGQQIGKQIGQQMTEMLKGLLLTERSNKIGQLALLIMGANSVRTSVICTSKCFSRLYFHGPVLVLMTVKIIPQHTLRSSALKFHTNPSSYPRDETSG